MQLFTNSQISTPQCYYTVVMAFRGRKKKLHAAFAQSKSGMPLWHKLSITCKKYNAGTKNSVNGELPAPEM
jgi:hypothetical protein